MFQRLPDIARGATTDSSRRRLMLPGSIDWLLIGYTAVVLVAGWTYTALRIHADREQTVRAASDRLRAVGGALETGTLAMLNDGVGAALAGANDVTHAGGFHGLADAEVLATLQRMLTGGQYVRSLFIASADRFVRAGRDGHQEAAPGLPRWLVGIQLPPASNNWVGAPFVDPEEPARIVVPIAHRIQFPRDPPLWAGAVFDFRAADALQKRIEGSQSALGMISDDGTVLLAIPDVSARRVVIGAHVPSNSLLKPIPREAVSGVVSGFAPMFGANVLGAYHRVTDYPLLLFAGETLDVVLVGWRERTRDVLVISAGTSLLLLFTTGLLYQAVRRLRRRELHYRTLFNNATFSAFLLERERFVAANDTVMRMFGFSHGQTAIGMMPWELSPLQQPDGRPTEALLRERIAAALHGGGTTFELTCKRLDNGATFPAQVDLSTLATGEEELAFAVVHDMTERKRAEQQLTESEQRYRALVESLPEAVYVHRGAEILFANGAAANLAGAQSPEALIGIPVLSFALESERTGLADRVRQILNTGSAAPIETRIRRLDGAVIWVELDGVRIQFAGAPAVQSVLRDITERKRREDIEATRAERVRQQSATLLRLANRRLAGYPDMTAPLRAVLRSTAEVLLAERAGIWLLEAASRTLRCVEQYDSESDGVCELRLIDLVKLPACLEALGQERVLDATDISNDPRLQELGGGAGTHSKPARSLIAAAIRAGGELIGVLTFAQVNGVRAWQVDEVTFAAGVADQIAQILIDTRREELLVELRALAGELMRAQDEERRRIGRDLHDSTGQTLAVLELELSRLADDANSLLTPVDRERITSCAHLAGQCSGEIRTASYLLHPPLLDELGLVSALRWLADGVRTRANLVVRLDLPDDIGRLAPAEELTLFRVAQEALTNVHRHAGSSWVGIRLVPGLGWMQLEIEDGGRGTQSWSSGRRAVGVGLAGMRERMRQVGGELALESSCSGTRVVARLPLGHAQASDVS